MQNLNMNKYEYGLLPVNEMALYIARDHLDNWFQSMADYDKMREIEARSKAKTKARR